MITALEYAVRQSKKPRRDWKWKGHISF